MDPESHGFRVQWTSEVDKHMGLGALLCRFLVFWSVEAIQLHVTIDGTVVKNTCCSQREFESHHPHDVNPALGVLITSFGLHRYTHTHTHDLYITYMNKIEVNHYKNLAANRNNIV